MPLAVLELAVDAVRLAAAMVEGGLATAVTDAGTGTRVGRAAAEGAYLNVRINLVGIRENDAAWAAARLERAEELLAEAREVADAAWPLIEKTIEG